MAKLSRVLLKLFGGSGATSNFGEFGSRTAGSPVNTKDILTIQALSAWANGWQEAINSSNKAPFLEDMNALHYVMAYQLAYGLQEGVPEYDSTTTYYIGSMVKKTGTSELYKSLTDTNLGNALPSKTDNTNWQYVMPKGILQYDSGQTYGAGEIVVKAGTAELYKSLIGSNVGNALPNQVSSGIWAYLVDLSNITPPVAGVSSIKFGFAPVSLTYSASSSASVSKNPQGDFGFDAGMSVYGIVMITHTGFDFNSGSPASSFGYTLNHDIMLSGSGVDASNKFVSGGAASTTYTVTLTATISESSLGSAPTTIRGIAIFIGIK